MEVHEGCPLEALLWEWYVWPSWALALASSVLAFRRATGGIAFYLLVGAAQAALLAIVLDFALWCVGPRGCFHPGWPAPHLLPSVLGPLAILAIPVCLRTRWRDLDSSARRAVTLLGIALLDTLLVTVGLLALLSSPYDGVRRVADWLGGGF